MKKIGVEKQAEVEVEVKIRYSLHSEQMGAVEKVFKKN